MARLRHIALTVPDPEKAAKFYMEAFGLRRVGGTDWAGGDVPVNGDDLDAAIAVAGVTFEPGDALLLRMGRDAYEAAGNVYSFAVVRDRAVLVAALFAGADHVYNRALPICPLAVHVEVAADIIEDD